MYTSDLSTTLSMNNLSCQDGPRYRRHSLSLNLKMLLHSTILSPSYKVSFCFSVRLHRSLPNCLVFNHVHGHSLMSEFLCLSLKEQVYLRQMMLQHGWYIHCRFYEDIILINSSRSICPSPFKSAAFMISSTSSSVSCWPRFIIVHLNSSELM